MTKADLKTYDELRADQHALDKKLTRLEERLSALAHEVEMLKRQIQPVNAVSTRQ